MTYIKLLTVLAGLALLTACGGAAAPESDKAGDNATDCTTNAFHADCDADAPAIIALRQSQCLEDTDIDSTCVGETGIATVFCKDNPFDTSNACKADTGAIQARQTMCLADIMEDDSCGAVIMGVCEANPFRAETACEHADYDDDRETACQMFGTDTGGHATCADSLISVCLIANPFIHPGCDDVVGIDMGLRKTYCEDSANAWNPKCLDGTHGTVVSFRTIACLESPFGTPANPLCVTDSFTETTCEMNPFASANPGCANLTDYKNIVKTYCMTNDAADCPNVTTADWVASFTTEPATTPTTGTPKNEFLQATGGTLPTGALTNSDGSAITVVPKLTLNANDGVAFFQGYSGNSATEYAGIFDTTDLGAPLTETSGSAIWNGRFRSVGFPVETDFMLEVTFGMDVNVQGSVGSIDAFVSAGSNFYYLIEGTFNDAGVIKGMASSGLFMGKDRNTPMGALEGGVLTGLIGAEGAVGAFYTNATLTAGASGGFVAKPTAPDTEPLVVNHGDWLRGFFKAPPARLDDTNPRRQFLAGDTAGLDTTGTVQEPIPNDGNILLTLDSARYNGQPLGGSRDASDGVAAFFDDGDTIGDTVGIYYAGILSDTDLGAPLTQASGSVKWYGQISTIFIGILNINKKDFELEITFGANPAVDGSAGSIEGIVQSGSSSSTNHYQLTGTYDAGGVITGEVIFGIFTGSLAEGNLETAVTPNGILTGLIGEQGAVGAFIAGAGAKEAIVGPTGYVGGFVAAPPVVNTGDLPTYPTKPNAETSTRFLTATETGLNITDIQFEGSATRTILNPHFIGRRGLDSNNPDGFAYFVTTSANLNPIGYVGILPTTNLGAPLPSTTANAVWAGHFSVAGSNNIATNYFVDFTNGKFGFSNAAEDDTDGTLTVSTATYTMNAHFGSHNDASSYSAGRMGGTIGISDVATTASATIVGLIGAEGAVGVFTQAVAATGYTGGFTATNPDYTPPE